MLTFEIILCMQRNERCFNAAAEDPIGQPLFQFSLVHYPDLRYLSESCPLCKFKVKFAQKKAKEAIGINVLR